MTAYSEMFEKELEHPEPFMTAISGSETQGMDPGVCGSAEIVKGQGLSVLTGTAENLFGRLQHK